MNRGLGSLLLLCSLAACGGRQYTDTTEAGVRGADSGAEQDAGLQVIQVQASRWAYDPATITLHEGEPVILELRSTDVHHGFNVPGLGLRADVLPDRPTRVRVTPKAAGTFLFRCDYYCGSGHEGMEGQIIVQ
jgi:cytochrome c oxidase subunit 2